MHVLSENQNQIILWVEFYLFSAQKTKFQQNGIRICLVFMLQFVLPWNLFLWQKCFRNSALNSTGYTYSFYGNNGWGYWPLSVQKNTQTGHVQRDTTLAMWNGSSKDYGELISYVFYSRFMSSKGEFTCTRWAVHHCVYHDKIICIYSRRLKLITSFFIRKHAFICLHVWNDKV